MAVMEMRVASDAAGALHWLEQRVDAGTWLACSPPYPTRQEAADALEAWLGVLLECSCHPRQQGAGDE